MDQRQSALLQDLGCSQSQISASHPELSFDGEPVDAKDRAVKAKPFSFLKQILNSGYFLWRIESQDLNYRQTSEVFGFGSRPPK